MESQKRRESERLKLTLNGKFLREVALDRKTKITIGRSPDNVVVVNDENCSRFHAHLTYTGEDWLFHDLGSLNGTRINEIRVTMPMVLKHGDVIRISGMEMEFADPAAGSESTVGPNEGSLVGQMTVHPLIENSGANLAWSESVRAGKWTKARLEKLLHLGFEAGSASDMIELARNACEGLAELIEADACAIHQVVGDNPVVQGVYVANPKGITPHYYRPRPSMVSDVLSKQQPVIVEEQFSAEGSAKIGHSARLSILVPIVSRQAKSKSVFGFIHAYWLGENPRTSLEDCNAVITIAGSLSHTMAELEKYQRVISQVQSLRQTLQAESEMVFASDALQKIHSQIALVANTNANILVRGESGAGKELVARAVHYSSERKENPFVCLNCAALPDSLLESELFGHEKGAFTGAIDAKPGKFELASEGTIFLDEVGELSLPAQAKILRIIEGHPYERLGGSKPIKSNARVVAATNRDLEQAVAEKTFRQDLYYRLQVIVLHVPPLRERVDDIQPLALHFLQKFSQRQAERRSHSRLKPLINWRRTLGRAMFASCATSSNEPS